MDKWRELWKRFRRSVGRFMAMGGVRRSLARRWGCSRDREKPPAWYDAAYTRAEREDPGAESVYIPLWAEICERLTRAGVRRVLEIGCGMGGLAQMLLDRGIESYVGLDFSKKAVEIARRREPRGRFIVGDARTTSAYSDVEHDAIVCTELLEHVEDDLAIVARFRPGVRCLFSVPNFPYRSHVRYFDGPQSARARYAAFFDGLDVTTLKSPRNPKNEFYLLEGIRNRHGARA